VSLFRENRRQTVGRLAVREGIVRLRSRQKGTMRRGRWRGVDRHDGDEERYLLTV
jgi:hypothetical protein